MKLKATSNHGLDSCSQLQPTVAVILPSPLQKPLIQSKWLDELENADPDRFGDSAKMRREQ